MLRSTGLHHPQPPFDELTVPTVLGHVPQVLGSSRERTRGHAKKASATCGGAPVVRYALFTLVELLIDCQCLARLGWDIRSESSVCDNVRSYGSCQGQAEAGEPAFER